jgi:hypothetical protein
MQLTECKPGGKVFWVRQHIYTTTIKAVRILRAGPVKVKVLAMLHGQPAIRTVWPHRLHRRLKDIK